MEPNLDQQRRPAHALIDALPAEKLSAVKSLLEVGCVSSAAETAEMPVSERYF